MVADPISLVYGALILVGTNKKLHMILKHWAVNHETVVIFS